MADDTPSAPAAAPTVLETAPATAAEVATDDTAPTAKEDAAAIEAAAPSEDKEGTSEKPTEGTSHLHLYISPLLHYMLLIALPDSINRGPRDREAGRAS